MTMTIPTILAVYGRGLDAKLGTLIGASTVVYFALKMIEYSMIGMRLGAMVAIAAGFILFYGSTAWNGAGEAFLLKLLYLGLMFFAGMLILVPPF